MNRLRLHLDGPVHGIDARALRDGLDTLLTLVNSVANAEDEPSSGPWVLAELSLSSLNCAVMPAPSLHERGQARLNTVWSGLEHLAWPPGIPEGWSGRAVQALVELADLRKFDGVDGCYLGRDHDRPIPLDARIRENAERSSGVARESLGEAQGPIIRYLNDGKNREISIHDTSAGRRIKVSFPNHLDGKILKLYSPTALLLSGARCEGIARGRKFHSPPKDLGF